MNENILKEFYIGRTVFLEPVNFEKEHTENLLETLTLLEQNLQLIQYGLTTIICYFFILIMLTLNLQ